jgi:thiol-disulfide isomerase/thioredoxin
MPRSYFSLVLLLCLSYATIASPGSPGPAVGSIAPDFSAPNLLTGKTIPLISQRGKVVILAFWNPWCGSCRRELPLLEKAQTLIGRDKLTIFAVSFPEDPAAAGSIRKLASTWHISMIEDGGGVVASRYAIATIPHLFIIGPDGKVLANSIGYGDRTLHELIDDINDALAGTPPAEPPTRAQRQARRKNEWRRLMASHLYRLRSPQTRDGARPIPEASRVPPSA